MRGGGSALLTSAHLRIFRQQLWRKLFSRRVPCPLCSSVESTLVFRSPNVHMAVFRDIFAERVVLCASCGFVYTNPRLSARNLEKYYSRNYRLEGLEVPKTLEEFLGLRYREIWFSKERDLQLVLAQKSSGRLLDIGCASGTLLWLAKEKGFQVSGVEVGKESVAFARNVLGLDVFCGQLSGARFPAASFDVVTMFHSLEHVPEPLPVVREIARILAPDGVFIVVVPNFAAWSSEHDGAHWKWLQPQNHYSHFTPQTLARLAGRAGFYVEISSEEGRYGEAGIQAAFPPGQIPQIYSGLKGSELILIARKQLLQPAVDRSVSVSGSTPASESALSAVPVVAPKKSLVSVLIDTFNHERFIEQAILSVLEQDFPLSDREILVVDDGSTDRTPEIVRKFEPRVRLLRKPNGGQASAFNAIIPQARGGILAFLDGDDWWAPQKLSHVVEAMSADPALGIVGNGIVTVQRNGSEHPEIPHEGHQFHAATPEGARLFRLRRSFLGTSRMTIRAALLRRIGRVPEAIAIEADEYLFTLAAVLAPARIIPEPLTYYRLHENNGFQTANRDPLRMRNLQVSLAALAEGLADQLGRCPMDPQARRLILELVQAEAARPRLTLDGGWPWETVRAEWVIYRTFHPDAGLSQRLLKSARLLPGILMPPAAFYRLQRRIANSGLYLRARGPAPSRQEPQIEAPLKTRP
jgi:SAM-dependent methyltransferase/GT2 family glycosyltransferase